MNPTNKSDVEQFFRTWNKTEIMMNSRQDIQDIKREMITYMSHEITDTELIVSWVLGNKIDMGDTTFNLQDFYAWAESNCQDRKLWTKQVHNHFEGSDYLTESVFDIYSYVKANETQLVTEYFNLKK